jgi:hypothetical protein
MLRDAQEFGPIVDAIVGKAFERSLAVNSIKLRFGTQSDLKGTHYIRVDPPWEFHDPDGIVTTSDEYTDEGFTEWCRLFDPINSGVLESWTETADGVVVFRFKNGYSIFPPNSSDSRDEDEWYSHWYAADRITPK